ALAQRLGEVLRILQLGREQQCEAISGNTRPECTARQPLAHELTELTQHGVADVHAEVVVDDVKLVDIDVNRGPMAYAILFGHDAAHALFECRTHVQTTERIEAALDDAHGFTGQDVAEACVAIREVGTYLVA